MKIMLARVKIVANFGLQILHTPPPFGREGWELNQPEPGKIRICLAPMMSLIAVA